MTKVFCKECRILLFETSKWSVLADLFNQKKEVKTYAEYEDGFRCVSCAGDKSKWSSYLDKLDKKVI